MAGLGGRMPDAGILRVCLFCFMTLGFRYAHDGGAPEGVLMALWLAWMVVLVYFFADGRHDHDGCGESTLKP